jgi:hypothetical protein
MGIVNEPEELGPWFQYIWTTGIACTLIAYATVTGETTRQLITQIGETERIKIASEAATQVTRSTEHRTQNTCHIAT